MYKLDKLPYSYDDLEPYIDTHTLGLHKNKHQKRYLDKLNELLIMSNYDFKYSLEELTMHISEFKEMDKVDILFNLGGVINHNIYFNSMSPDRELPNPLLMYQIKMSFGGYDEFKKKFKESALAIKGSGYTFLVIDNDYLKIVNLSNQDNPYNYSYVPLIALDMWEHAYYLNYENLKDVYIDNFFEVVDFKYANRFFNNSVF